MTPFNPVTTEELQVAVDLWINDNSSALDIYGPINSWDVSLITNMDHLFSYKENFNDDIGDWDVSNVLNMNCMFLKASAFNQDISDWNVSNVTVMSSMFNEQQILTEIYQPGMSQMLQIWRVCFSLQILIKISLVGMCPMLHIWGKCFSLQILTKISLDGIYQAQLIFTQCFKRITVLIKICQTGMFPM